MTADFATQIAEKTVSKRSAQNGNRVHHRTNIDSLKAELKENKMYIAESYREGSWQAGSQEGEGRCQEAAEAAKRTEAESVSEKAAWLNGMSADEILAKLK